MNVFKFQFSLSSGAWKEKFFCDPFLVEMVISRGLRNSAGGGLGMVSVLGAIKGIHFFIQATSL